MSNITALTVPRLLELSVTRRLILAAAFGAALVGLALPSSAAGAAACATFTDPKGDGGISASGAPVSVPAPDPALDITAVKFASTAKALVATISLDKLSQRPVFAPGNRVQVTFTVKGKVVVVYYKYSATRSQEANVFYQQGIRVDGVFFSAVLVPEVKGNDVVLTVKLSELKSAVGASIVGQKLTDLKAEAMASYVATNQVWDTATAPAKTTYAVGASCK